MLGARFLLICAFVVFSGVSLGQPSGKELQDLSLFESLCLGHANDPDAIPALLLSKNAAEAAQFKTIVSAAPSVGSAFRALLTPLDGRSFKFKDSATEYLIAITDTGACSLVLRDADGDAIEALLKERVAARQIGKESDKGTMHVTYAVSYPASSGLVHALIFVDRPVRGQVLGVRLSSLAHQFLRARGLKEPEWPAPLANFERMTP
jgi:hypothetical protein